MIQTTGRRRGAAHCQLVALSAILLVLRTQKGEYFRLIEKSEDRSAPTQYHRTHDHQNSEPLTMAAVLARLLVGRGFFLLFSVLVLPSQAQVKSRITQQERAPRIPVLPNCDESGSVDCILQGPRPMSWEAAQHHCRSRNGFLLEKKELDDVQARLQTPFERNLTKTTWDVLTWPVLNGTLEEKELIWSALAPHSGHYQWMSRFPWIGLFNEWQEGIPPSARECAAFNLTSERFTVAACATRLGFYCVLHRSSRVPDINPNDVELRITASTKMDHGWVEISESDTKFSLDCHPYSISTGARLTQHLPVFWIKDDVYVHRHSNRIFPLDVNDSTKSRVLAWNHILNGSSILQGPYWCEAWVPGSPSRIMSNKVLVTLDSWTVLIVTADRKEVKPVNETTAIKDIKSLLRPELQNIDRYIVDPISINRKEISSDSGTLTSYRFHVHIPRYFWSNVRRFFDNNYLLQSYFAKHGYRNTSSVALPTYCFERTDIGDRGAHVLWPSKSAGNIRPRDMRCEVGDRLRPGICRWNYTHGAYLEFDASRCDRFDSCPRGYYQISKDLCVTFTRPADWEVGLSKVYKTGHEISILDSVQFHAARDTSSVYNLTKKILQETNGPSVVWLPVKRIVPRGPLTFLGPGKTEYPYDKYKGSSYFNIAWAKGHPDNNYECLALNVETDEMLTQSCDTENPFIAVINSSDLHQIPDNDSIIQMKIPDLQTENPACPEEWLTSAWQGAPLVCFKLFAKSGNYTLREAKAFCENEGAELPSPGVGFLDWVYRQYLHKHGVAEVWMTIEKPFWISDGDEREMDMINWLSDTDYSLRGPVLTPKGWRLVEEGKGMSSILCQKKSVEAVGLEIRLHKGRNKELCIDQEERQKSDSPLRCFTNGKKIDVFVNKSGCRNSIRMTGQGYYQCQKWTTGPFQLVTSNSFLHREGKYLTFSVRISENGPYNPEVHDSTFLDGSQSFDSCSTEFTEKFEDLYESQGFPAVKTFIDNYSYAPDRKNQGVTYRFHYNLQFLGKTAREEEVIKLFSSLLKTPDLFSGCMIGSIRSTTKCFSETTLDCGVGVRNLTWPDTDGAQVVVPQELCITVNGEPVTRECVGSFLDGYRWTLPSGSCVGNPTNKTRKLWQINHNETLEKDNIPTRLSNLTQDGTSLQPVDIHLVATSFKSLSEETDTISELDLEKIVETLNNVMEADDETFEPVQKALSSSSILFEAFESMTFKVQIPENDGDQKVNASKRLITVERLNLEANTTIIGFQSKDGGRVESTIEKGVKTDRINPDAAIILPENLTYTVATSRAGRRARMRSDNKIQLSFAVFRNSKLFQDRESYPNFTVSSPIIQATYNGQVVKDLKEPVTLIFKTPKHNRNKTKCVYWEPKKNSGKGGWSTQGCWRGKGNGNHEVCHCNHLTCFAQLMNYDDADFEGDHALALDIITIIGCCLSIVGLLLVFTTFFLFKKWRRPLDNKILVNLSFSVFCSIVIFLAGINQTWNKILCRSIAVALHYFILASFGWMLVEAVHQYLKFVKVVGTYIPRFMWKASVTAWGMPVVPIIVVLVCDSSLYDNGDELLTESNICWMSTKGFLYAFLPPLLLTMTINIIMFSLIIYGAVCGRARVNSTMSERSLFISQLRMAICVFILLGFTWIFGILAIWKGRILFSYLFCIFNTLQGFFIFIFHVYRGRSARRLWRDFLSVITKSPTSTSNSNNAHNSMQYRGQLDSVTYNHGGGILVIPQKFSVHPSTRGMSIKSLGTSTSLLHSRTSFSP